MSLNGVMLVFGNKLENLDHPGPPQVTKMSTDINRLWSQGTKMGVELDRKDL